jgi:hypothetical protein
MYIYSRVGSQTSSLCLVGLAFIFRLSRICVLGKIEMSGTYLLLTCPSAVALLISFCKDPFSVSSSLGWSFRLSLVSGSSGSFISRPPLAYVSFCETFLS